MADRLRKEREAAWDAGRALRAKLEARYEAEYGVPPPAPALVVDEYLTDFLGAILHFDALPLDTYAEVRWPDGQPVVTVNARIPDMKRVLDAGGVENVAKCHELVHVVDDRPTVDLRLQGAFVGIDVTRTVTCYRSTREAFNAEARQREIWAEEAGRAFAISWRHLLRTTAFRQLLGLAGRPPGPSGWDHVKEAAAAIGVNRSALTKQLELEDCITIVETGGRKLLQVNPQMPQLLGVA